MGLCTNASLPGPHPPLTARQGDASACYHKRVKAEPAEWIVAEPGVVGGKPRVKGTRLSVAFLLGLLAQGWSEEEILENFPQLSREGLRAALQFASEALEEEGFIAVPSG